MYLIPLIVMLVIGYGTIMVVLVRVTAKGPTDIEGNVYRMMFCIPGILCLVLLGLLGGQIDIHAIGGELRGGSSLIDIALTGEIILYSTYELDYKSGNADPDRLVMVHTTMIDENYWPWLHYISAMVLTMYVISEAFVLFGRLVK